MCIPLSALDFENRAVTQNTNLSVKGIPIVQGSRRPARLLLQFNKATPSAFNQKSPFPRGSHSVACPEIDGISRPLHTMYMDVVSCKTA